MSREKDPIREKRIALEREEREARSEVLHEHLAKYAERQRQLNEECRASYLSHNFVPLPENGMNDFHFITGEWPHQCSRCRAPMSSATVTEDVETTTEEEATIEQP